jgi:adenylate kinase
MVRLIFLGAPGVGKGTQAKRLAVSCHIPQIATGEILRAAILKGDEIGLEARSYVDAGKLVPDELVIRIVQSRLVEDDVKEGFILDGFPRTKEQAQALDRMENKPKIDRVIYFHLEESELILRLSGRRSCVKCFHIYHVVYQAPRKEGLCDECGTILIQRKDDRPETVSERLSVYRKETAPLIQFFQQLGSLSQIEASGEVEEVERRVRAAAGIP